ncbi:putative membrane-associated kinase regulator 6 [Dorcoceras hygrometricum]|uniref:Putative membrane-associated kinase regulator 6 n=1 Tax=Dorcoceras hygrometricum TaxID=472368 RepID=A0A2Z7AK64_9LAMI|nr:putative membrane-associated kinase regulator 6 [Dorcoceras hygrometricum]
MENCESLTATESFSYSWLIDRKPSSGDEFLSNFTPRMVEGEENFNFDVPVTDFAVSLAHADEIFSDGHIMPLFVDRSKTETFKKTSFSTPPSPVSSSKGAPFVVHDRSQYYYMMGKWRKSSKRILQKCFGFMKPLRKTRKSSRVDDLERKVSEIQGRGDSLETSPRPSSASSVVEWDHLKIFGKKVDVYYGLKRVKSLSTSPLSSPRLSPSNSSNVLSTCDVESSIHEAILYCKRSIGKILLILADSEFIYMLSFHLKILVDV